MVVTFVVGVCNFCDFVAIRESESIKPGLDDARGVGGAHLCSLKLSLSVIRLPNYG